MNLSLGEFGALVAKAFRGAGYPWGLTEDAAHASMRLAEYGIDVGPVVGRLLETVEGQPTLDLMPTDSWDCHGELLCPICIGTRVMDLGECADLSLQLVAEPVLVGPFLQPLIRPDAGRHDGYMIEWDGGDCAVGAEHITIRGTMLQGVGAVKIGPSSLPSVASVQHSRVELRHEARRVLESFAHRTYAPATESSRLSGAG